jgi:hypothetical protein
VQLIVDPKRVGVGWRLKIQYQENDHYFLVFISELLASKLTYLSETGFLKKFFLLTYLATELEPQQNNTFYSISHWKGPGAGEALKWCGSAFFYL